MSTLTTACESEDLPWASKVKAWVSGLATCESETGLTLEGQKEQSSVSRRGGGVGSLSDGRLAAGRGCRTDSVDVW